MRKTLATIVLTGTLMIGAPSAMAATSAEPADTCGTSSTAEPVIGTSCQERVFELEAVVYALESHVRGLQFRVMDLRWRLDQKRKTIRHLRAELREARAN